MPLEELAAGCRELDCLSVVIVPPPTGAELAIAFGAGESPDPAVVVQSMNRVAVQLEELVARRQCRSARVVIQSLPPRTRIPCTRRSRVPPDPAIEMKLVQVAAVGKDRHGLRVVV